MQHHHKRCSVHGKTNQVTKDQTARAVPSAKMAREPTLVHCPPKRAHGLRQSIQTFSVQPFTSTPRCLHFVSLCLETLHAKQERIASVGTSVARKNRRAPLKIRRNHSFQPWQTLIRKGGPASFQPSKLFTQQGITKEKAGYPRSAGTPCLNIKIAKETGQPTQLQRAYLPLPSSFPFPRGVGVKSNPNSKNEREGKRTSRS